MLLAAIGAGAVAGAFVVGRLRETIGVNALVNGSMVVYGISVVVIGAGQRPEPAIPALMAAGAAWIGVQSTLDATAQVLLPAWTRARALAYFQLVFMGGQTLGSIGWGVVADLAGLRAAFAIPGFALLAVAAVTVRTLRLPRTSLDVSRTLRCSPQHGRARFPGATARAGVSTASAAAGNAAAHLPRALPGRCR